MSDLRAPFPWFGGKRRVAEVVWRAFGDVPNYVEPFAGSLAVLLGRPHAAKTETVNDLDCYLANFWRALQAEPDALADAVDWPVNEADLHARHLSLVTNAGFRERMKTEPEHYDVTVAAWWVWGICQWIGTGWCSYRERGDGRLSQQLPHLGDAGRGVHRKLPHLGDAGRESPSPSRQLPELGYGERVLRKEGNTAPRSGVWLSELGVRLRRVRVACGDWSRVTGDSVTWRHGITGVFLDPPYDDGAVDYADGGLISTDVRAWALEAGKRKDMRIALCGYDGEHEMPGWYTHEWKAHGGYASQGDGSNENAKRERIWFSPACLPVDRQTGLFGVMP